MRLYFYCSSLQAQARRTRILRFWTSIAVLRREGKRGWPLLNVSVLFDLTRIQLLWCRENYRMKTEAFRYRWRKVPVGANEKWPRKKSEGERGGQRRTSKEKPITCFFSFVSRFPKCTFRSKPKKNPSILGLFFFFFVFFWPPLDFGSSVLTFSISTHFSSLLVHFQWNRNCFSSVKKRKEKEKEKKTQILSISIGLKSCFIRFVADSYPVGFGSKQKKNVPKI